MYMRYYLDRPLQEIVDLTAHSWTVSTQIDIHISPYLMIPSSVMSVHSELFYNYLLISAGPEGTQLVQGIGPM